MQKVLLPSVLCSLFSLRFRATWSFGVVIPISLSTATGEISSNLTGTVPAKAQVNESIIMCLKSMSELNIIKQIRVEILIIVLVIIKTIKEKQRNGQAAHSDVN